VVSDQKDDLPYVATTEPLITDYRSLIPESGKLSRMPIKGLMLQ
jgi:hypothetical protein